MDKYPIRRPHRLRGYNYSQTGYYFVTICTYNRDLILGEIIKTVGPRRAVAVTVALNEYGKIVSDEWQNTQRLRENVELDEYVIMPNHIHGIIITRAMDTTHSGTGYTATRHSATARRGPTAGFGTPVSGSLSTIIRSFKSAVTKRINELRNATTPPVWQPSFYDHIIRTDKSLHDIRDYIVTNPMSWDIDENNPNLNHSLKSTKTAAVFAS